MKKIIHFLVLFVLVVLPFQTGAAAPLGLTANSGTYDDRDATVWTYTGAWMNRVAWSSYNRTLKLSRTLNSEAGLTFNGERFELIYARGASYGALDVYVDDVFEASLNQYNATNQFQQRWSSPAYANGLHTVRFVHASGRYANVDGIQIFAPPDLTPPDAIADLAANVSSPGCSSLTWSAPGDDGAAGTASSYLARYSALPILTETDWDNAFPVTSGIPVPAAAGSGEAMSVCGLAPGETYSFSVRAQDEEPNSGGLSNSPSAAAGVSTPLAVGKVDDRNADLIYAGSWSNLSSFGAYARTLRSSALIGNALGFMFNGTDFELSYQASRQQGVMAIYVDGDFVANLNQYSAVTRNQQRWNSPAFTNGTHSVQLRHASGARVNLDAVQTRLTANWPDISLQQVANGFNSPILVTHAGDGSGRLFVVQQSGQIAIMEGGVVTGEFLDISSEIASGGEQGLLSLAFPPDYESSGHFYVFYTNTSGNLVVSRIGLTGDPDVADLSSEEIVLTIPHPGETNHNGGHLAFGPDGYLYLSTGDGGGGDPNGNGQNLNTLLAKMIRIDVETGDPATYTIPADNPFVGVAGADEIWAYGLRNPWRYSFDRLTGDLYIGDVGQGEWEEVDFQAAGFAGGANYGWNTLEGNHCYSPANGCVPPAGYVAPVAEYNHSLGCSITGGYVYRGAAYPTLQGIYFYSDYCSGRIWGMRNSGGTWVASQLDEAPFNVSSFGEDEAGNLYVVDLGGAIYLVTSP
ncbi:MAG: hypothetical protein HFACDABA_00202 [Anaerolineales bacterium]|nr:hypothetical protein [Anaerolineales bacterium]